MVKKIVTYSLPINTQFRVAWIARCAPITSAGRIAPTGARSFSTAAATITKRVTSPALMTAESSADVAAASPYITLPFGTALTNNEESIFAEGFAQVTDVYDKVSHTSELYDVPSHNLAGASPHAPDPRRWERRKKKDTKGSVLNIRMPCAVKAKLAAKAAAAESYPSAYVLKLVAADLSLPIDEKKNARSRGLQEQIAALTVALNKQGGLFNQIAAALNRGQDCPITRQEVDAALRRHMAATNAILKLGFD